MSAGTRLNELLVVAGLEPVNQAIAQRFEAYVSLILRWNARINLTAVRDQEGILSRHILESIWVARNLPGGIETLLDLGSGAGLPGIPIALCRPEIAVTLSESQGKKAAFLEEAVRILEIGVKVHASRAERLTEKFDCVAMRAVDRMAEAVIVGASLVNPGGRLALMTTRSGWPQLQQAAGGGFTWDASMALPGGKDRILALGERPSDPA